MNGKKDTSVILNTKKATTTTSNEKLCILFSFIVCAWSFYFSSFNNIFTFFIYFSLISSCNFSAWKLIARAANIIVYRTHKESEKDSLRKLLFSIGICYQFFMLNVRRFLYLIFQTSIIAGCRYFVLPTIIMLNIIELKYDFDIFD